MKGAQSTEWCSDWFVKRLRWKRYEQWPQRHPEAGSSSPKPGLAGLGPHKCSLAAGLVVGLEPGKWWRFSGLRVEGVILRVEGVDLRVDGVGLRV